MRAAVEQILALEVDFRRSTDVAAQGERGGAAGIFGEQFIELGAEGWIFLAVEERRLELFQRGEQNLGDEAAAVFSEATI